MQYFERACLLHSLPFTANSGSKSPDDCVKVGEKPPNLRMESVYEILKYYGDKYNYNVKRDGIACYCSSRPNCNGKDRLRADLLIVFFVLCWHCQSVMFRQQFL